MSSNLVNVYELMKKNYHDFNILYRKPPSYIKTITGIENKIIFVCEEFLDVSKRLTPHKVKAISKGEDSNLIGSPLKDECDVDALNVSLDFNIADLPPWAREEEFYKPIKLDQARILMSNHELQAQGTNEKTSGSLWFLCEPNEHDSSIFLSLNFEYGWNSIGIIRYHGLIGTNTLNVTDLINTHNSCINGENKIDTKIECFYNIRPNISLKLSWSTSAMQPQLINTKSSDATLFQTIQIEGNNSVAEHFWRQLSILSLIYNDVTHFKTDNQTDQEIVYKWGRGIDIDILRDKVISAMTELSTYYGGYNHDDDDIQTVVIKAKTRAATDLTDKLWEILKCCSSYKDLKMAFTNVFQCAAQRNIVNMPANKNSLAEIIREVSQRRLAIPCLVGSEPLELLLEIGLEKLQKDYEYIFVESKICSVTDLQLMQNSKIENEMTESNLNVRNTLHNAMKSRLTKADAKDRKTLLHNLNTENETNYVESIGFQNSKYNEKDVELKLLKLGRIHLALEHLLSIQINLNLQNVYNQMFEQLLQKPLQPLSLITQSTTDSIAMPILTDKIFSHVDKRNPNARRIVMSSSNKFKQVESTFYYNLKNIFPPNTFEKLQALDEKQTSKENFYYYWNYLKVKSRRF